MSDINIGNFSDTLSRKADCDLRNIDTTKCDMVIEYQEPDPENEYKWYRLYASGWVEQGGVTPKNVSSHLVTLPIQMLDTTYNVYCTQHRVNTTTGGFERAPGAGDLTVTTMYIDMNKQANEDVFWQVSGLADMTHHEILPNPTSNTARALVIQVLEGMYPVGSVYLGTQSVCPMSVFFGTWELVSSGKALWTGDGTNANTTIEAGLPNIIGSGTFYSGLRTGSTPDGAFYVESTSGSGAMLDGSDPKQRIKFDASRSSAIYGNSNTVQPPAYVVNVWKRTA